MFVFLKLAFCFSQDVWDDLFPAPGERPEDLCLWLWSLNSRWEGRRDHHWSGEPLPVSLQLLLWPTTDLLHVGQPVFGSSQDTWFKYLHRQDMFLLFIFNFLVILALVSTSGGTSWSHLRFWRTWLVWKACPNPGLKTMAHHSSSMAKSTRWLNLVNCGYQYDRFPSILLLMIYRQAGQLLDAVIKIFYDLMLPHVLTSREQHGNPPALGSSQGTTLSARAPKTGTCPWTCWVPDALQHLSAQSLSGLNSCWVLLHIFVHLFNLCIVIFLGKPSDVGGCFSQIPRSTWASIWRHTTQSQKVRLAPLCWSVRHIRH